MRKLVVFRGHQGSGKSHTIDKLGLREWTISSDTLRTVFSGPILTADGRITLNQDVNGQVFTMINEVADRRMAAGETLVIDTTGVNISDFTYWREKARLHRYKIAFVDLTEIPMDVALARQEGRSEVNQVPETSLRRFHSIMLENPLTVEDPETETLIKGDMNGSHIDALSNWLKEPIFDLSAYRRIVHVGDIQGCFSVLAGKGSPFEYGFADDTFYIFVGDLLDRGVENGKVMRWFVDNAIGRKNVALMHGNHEDHLHRWARSMEAVSNEFRYRTLPQLEEEGLTPEDADRICDMAREYMRYDYRGTQVFVNHAGLSTLPREPWMVSLNQYSKGTGHWSDDVDGQYASHVHDVYQVHGHRNQNGVPIRATSMSLNLEDGVEFGGHLRTCTLDANGWSTAQFRNRVFRPLPERLRQQTVMSDHRVQEQRKYPDWIRKGEISEKHFDEGLLARMENHPGVKEKPNLLFPNVYSLNFTRDVFYDKAWDDVVVKARGLFVDRESGDFVARGYDKFFNIGEMPETQVDVLVETMKFPITLYLKENGYLGNLGYDPASEGLMHASKSTPDGDFARWFKEIFEEKVPDAQAERLMRYLRDVEASMTFEVIDPVRDPHIIEYDEPNIVLLDVVRLSSNFRKVDYETLEVVADTFGFDVKKRSMSFNTKFQFLNWYRSAERDLSFTVKGRPVEGFVIEDASGFMTKWKSPYYRFWKQMRAQHLRVSKALQNGQVKSNPATGIRGTEWMTEEMVERAVDFNSWMLSKSADQIGQDIISARKLYEADRGYNFPGQNVKRA